MIEAFIFKIVNIFFNRPYIKRKLKKCGKNFRLGYRSELRNAIYFSIGDDFFSGPYGYFVTNKFIPVNIGDQVMFGPFCKIFGGDHDLGYSQNHIRFAPEKEVLGSQIVIEDGVWIGANTTILTNAIISEGVIVASGAIVNNYIPPYCIAYGTPAKRIKKRFENEVLLKVLKNVESKYTLDQIMEIYHKYDLVS